MSTVAVPIVPIVAVPIAAMQLSCSHLLRQAASVPPNFQRSRLRSVQCNTIQSILMTRRRRRRKRHVIYLPNDLEGGNIEKEPVAKQSKYMHLQKAFKVVRVEQRVHRELKKVNEEKYV